MGRTHLGLVVAICGLLVCSSALATPDQQSYQRKRRKASSSSEFLRLASWCRDKSLFKEEKEAVILALRSNSKDRQAKRRLETIRFRLRVHSGKRDLNLCSDYKYRIYTADQFRGLLATVPEFELMDVYDFWYEIDKPLELNDEMGDCVFILKRRSR